jgi:hypothetical protein
MNHFDIYEAVVYKGEAIESDAFNDQPMMWLLCQDGLHDDTQFQIQTALAHDTKLR